MSSASVTSEVNQSADDSGETGVGTPTGEASSPVPLTPPPRHGWRSWRGADLVLVGIMAAGCALRIAQWMAPRMYSHDEISVLFSIRTMPIGRLLNGPLLLAQGAPPLWLAGEFLVSTVLGFGERTMRAIPVFFACLSVILVALLARRVLGPVAAAVATALFAVAPLTAFYAWQVKPYSADTAVAAGLLLLAVTLGQRRWNWLHGVLWWTAAAVAAGLSFPSLFLVGGVSLALVGGRLAGWTPGDPGDRRLRVGECVWFCVPSVLWLAATGAVYLLQLRHLDGLQGDYPMWSSGYGPTGGSIQEYWSWTKDLFSALIGSVWLASVTWGARILAVVGAVLLWRRNRGTLLMVIAPLVVAYGAAVAHSYPLKSRLALWIVPSLVLLIAEPVRLWPDRLSAVRRWWHRLPVRLVGLGVASLLVATVLVPAVRSSVYITASTDRYDLALRAQGHPIDRLLSTIQARQRPGDRFVTQETYFNKALWYGHDRDVRVDGVLAAVGVDSGCQPDAYRLAAEGASRLWFLGGESWLVTDPAFPEVVLAQLRTLGHVTVAARQGPVALYQVELTAVPDSRSARPTDQAPCARFGTWPNPLE